jgi:hypothetical protein
MSDSLTELALEVFQLPNASEHVRKFAMASLAKVNMSVELDKHGNVIACRGSAPYYPTLNAHLDTVFDEKKPTPKDVFYDPKKRVVWSPQGLGGDDRCGVIAALYIAQVTNLALKIILTDDEESGCIGAHALSMKHLDNCAYIAVIDRRGERDIIFDAAGTKTASDTFASAVCSVVDGKYNKVHGALSDTVVWAEHGIDSFNISAGYFNPHTTSEYVNLDSLARTIDLIKTLLTTLPPKKWRHKPTPRYSRGWHGKGISSLWSDTSWRRYGEPNNITLSPCIYCGSTSYSRKIQCKWCGRVYCSDCPPENIKDGLCVLCEYGGFGMP